MGFMILENRCDGIETQMRFGRIFFVIILLVCIFETVRLWGIAPAQVASHFDILGNPDHFTTKAQFFAFEIETMLVVIGLGVLTQVFVLITPVEWINMKMPNRDYWLAPEHRDEIMDRINSFVAILFGIVALGVQAGFELAVSANLHQPIHFDSQAMLIVIAGLFVATPVMLVWLMISFRIPASKS
ncbi:MAG: DUF1648 domain-containing protein [Anaerolineales bacterium]